jgi:RHS repeat-associated protein
LSGPTSTTRAATLIRKTDFNGVTQAYAAQKTSRWGQTTGVPGSSTDCPLRLPGQYHDGETGLDYSYFRYYSSEDAAFPTPDPPGVNPAPNPYAYILNPLTWSDPLGLAGCPAIVTVKWEEGMPKSQFKRKADALQKLSDDGKLSKAPNPVDRDVASNLHILDSFTSQRVGTRQIWPQIRSLPDHTPIRIGIEGPPS